MMLADAGADVLRLERAAPGAVERGEEPASRSRAHWDLLNRSRPSVGIDLKHPDAVELVLGPRRGGRRAGRGVPARRGRAARPRARRLPRPQPAARLRAHDRLGPGRAACARPPATTSTTSRSPARCGRSGARASARCRRSTWSATSAAAACCSPSAWLAALVEAATLGPGPGGRRRDGRRLRVAHDHDPRLPRRAASGPRRAARTSSTPARTSTRSTRPRTAVDGGGRHRAAVLRRAARGARADDDASLPRQMDGTRGRR